MTPSDATPRGVLLREFGPGSSGTGPPPLAGPVLTDNMVHVLVFLVLGVVTSWLVAGAERLPVLPVLRQQLRSLPMGDEP